MSEIQSRRPRRQRPGYPVTLGEIVLASYELQAYARGVLTLRLLRAIGRRAMRVVCRRAENRTPR